MTVIIQGHVISGTPKEVKDLIDMYTKPLPPVQDMEQYTKCDFANDNDLENATEQFVKASIHEDYEQYRKFISESLAQEKAIKQIMKELNMTKENAENIVNAWAVSGLCQNQKEPELDILGLKEAYRTGF